MLSARSTSWNRATLPPPERGFITTTARVVADASGRAGTASTPGARGGRQATRQTPNGPTRQGTHQGARGHVGRVVDARVHAGVGRRARQPDGEASTAPARSHPCSTRRRTPTRRDRKGRKEDTGRRTRREATTCPSPDAPGRRRRARDLSARLLVADATPIARTAWPAARLPRSPPAAATTPAVSNQRRESFAASDRRTRNRSRTGVCVPSDGVDDRVVHGAGLSPYLGDPLLRAHDPRTLIHMILRSGDPSSSRADRPGPQRARHGCRAARICPIAPPPEGRPAPWALDVPEHIGSQRDGRGRAVGLPEIKVPATPLGRPPLRRRRGRRHQALPANGDARPRIARALRWIPAGGQQVGDGAPFDRLGVLVEDRGRGRRSTAPSSSEAADGAVRAGQG